MVRAPPAPAPVVRSPAASAKPESRANPVGKTNTNTTVAQARPKEMTPPAPLTKPEEPATPPALTTKPEETPNTPIVPKLGDDTKSAPKPAATNDQTPAPE